MNSFIIFLILSALLQISAIICPAGQQPDLIGLNCINCPANTFSNCNCDNTERNCRCRSCERGSESGSGATYCTPCAVNTFASNNGGCVNCPNNFETVCVGSKNSDCCYNRANGILLTEEPRGCKSVSFGDPRSFKSGLKSLRGRGQ